MRFEHEDELIQRYIKLADRLDGRKAIDVIAMRGAYCAHCGGGPAIAIGKPPKSDRPPKLECIDCRRAWEGIEIPVFKGEVDVGRETGRSEAWLVGLVSDLVPLRSIVESRPRQWDLTRWRFARIAWAAYLNERIGTYANAAREGAISLPEFQPWWKERTVAYWVERARAVVRKRGQRARLLPRLMQ